MKALLLALMIVAAPASANAFCFSSFHQPKVEQKIETVNGVPVAIKTAAARKPDSFCQTVMRASAITLVVQGIVIGAKVALAVGTGVIIF
jgi:cyclic lactone autoinducer peptide